MKTLITKHLGKVTKFNSPPEPSYVTLKNTDDNKTYNADAKSEMLLNAGLNYDGCEFEVLIYQEDGKITGEVIKIKSQNPDDKPITEESPVQENKTPMKTLVTKYLGKVIKFKEPPEPSCVLLRNADDGDICQATMSSENLVGAGVNCDGCWFDVLVYYNKGELVSEIVKTELYDSDADIKKEFEQTEARIKKLEAMFSKATWQVPDLSAAS